MSKIKIILVDDHQIVRHGIKSLLKGYKEIEIIAEACSGIELRSLLLEHQPDILLMDISLPDCTGIELTAFVRKTYPEIRVLILSMYTEEEFIFGAIQAGAHGYIPKNSSKLELHESIITLFDGREYFSKQVSQIILDSYVKQAQNPTKRREIDILSSREIEVLKYFAEGKSNQEIAALLSISIRTVESHKNHMMTKLELKSLVDLVKFAIKNRVIEL